MNIFFIFDNGFFWYLVSIKKFVIYQDFFEVIKFRALLQNFQDQ